jgi:hypothetical protein
MPGLAQTFKQNKKRERWESGSIIYYSAFFNVCDRVNNWVSLDLKGVQT